MLRIGGYLESLLFEALGLEEAGDAVVLLARDGGEEGGGCCAPTGAIPL